MSRARKNNAREQRSRAKRMPNSTKHAVSSMDFIERKRMNPTKPPKRK